MTVTINDATMTSDQTAHTARLAPGQHLWEVSWLPGRALDRNSAITAMTLAAHASERDLNERQRLWPSIQSWAAELGLTGPEATSQASQPGTPSPATRPGTRAAGPRGGTMTAQPRRHHDRKPEPADVPPRIPDPAPLGDDSTAAASRAGQDPHGGRLAYHRQGTPGSRPAPDGSA